MLSDEDFHEVLGQFPQISFGFAYGSGVVEQGGYDYKSSEANSANAPMVDMVFVVDNTEDWHRLNMTKNPSHYTMLIPLPSKVIAIVQDSLGAGMWYNALVEMKTTRFPHRMMKYGIISRATLMKDLTQWTTLYAAGRLHKPVRVFKGDSEIEKAIKLNREQALRTSLLLMKPSFKELDLYYTIASLSYIGDPRMLVGENPKKVINLVNPIVPQYRELYKDALHSIGPTVGLKYIGGSSSSSDSLGSDRKLFWQDISPTLRWKSCLKLPITMRRLLLIQGRARYMKEKPPKRAAIRTALASIVARAASSQSIKGLFTVGAFKTVSYLYAKVSKRIFAPSGSGPARSFHTGTGTMFTHSI